MPSSHTYRGRPATRCGHTRVAPWLARGHPRRSLPPLRGSWPFPTPLAGPGAAFAPTRPTIRVSLLSLLLRCRTVPGPTPGYVDLLSCNVPRVIRGKEGHGVRNVLWSAPAA